MGHFCYYCIKWSEVYCSYCKNDMCEEHANTHYSEKECKLYYDERKLKKMNSIEDMISMMLP